jgi:hypothetical protein
VAVGQNVFIHDPNTARRTLRALGAGEITWIASCRGCWKRNSLRRSLDTAFVTGTVERMLSAARKPAAELGLQISGTAVAVGSINIAPHSDYAAIDRASIKLAEQAGAKLVTSVETTHGVIRAQAEAPFLLSQALPIVSVTSRTRTTAAMPRISQPPTTQPLRSRSCLRNSLPWSADRRPIENRLSAVGSGLGTGQAAILDKLPSDLLVGG